MGLSLLETLQGIIERTYAMRPVITDIAPYIVGDDGYRRFYSGGGPERPPRAGARVLCREEAGGVRLALYYPDALILHLERQNPLRGLGDCNVQELAVLVEELDHLLTLASRAAECRPITLLELEHHANVTKYLVITHLLGRHLGRQRLPEMYRIWARHQVFGRYSGAAGEEAERYRMAARLAANYVGHLDRLPWGERREELRALRRRAFADTMRLLSVLN